MGGLRLGCRSNVGDGAGGVGGRNDSDRNGGSSGHETGGDAAAMAAEG